LIWFGISLLLSILSFFQWRERFQSTYKEMLSAYTVIFSELGKNKDKKVEKKKTANS
jgi:prolyl-tRNA synthetase